MLRNEDPDGFLHRAFGADLTDESRRQPVLPTVVVPGHSGATKFHQGSYSFEFNEQAPFRVLYAVSQQFRDGTELVPYGPNRGIFRVYSGYIMRTKRNKFLFYHAGVDRPISLSDCMIERIGNGRCKELWPHPTPKETSPRAGEPVELDPHDYPQLNLKPGIRIYRMPNDLIETHEIELKNTPLNPEMARANIQMAAYLEPGRIYGFYPPLRAPRFSDLMDGHGRLVIAARFRYDRFDPNWERHILIIEDTIDERPVTLAARITRRPFKERD